MTNIYHRRFRATHVLMLAPGHSVEAMIDADKLYTHHEWLNQAPPSYRLVNGAVLGIDDRPGDPGSGIAVRVLED